MHKFFIISFFTFINSFFLTAQNSTNSLIIGKGDLSDGVWVVNKSNQKKIDGTPYLFKNWFQKGKIYFEDRTYIIDALNYNVQAERFEAKISDDSVFALNHGNFYKVEINGKSFSRHLDPDFQRNTYFEDIIHFKSKQLLKKYAVKIKEGQVNPMTMQKIQPDKYIKNEQFYILKDSSDELKKVKLKKSTILSLIDESNKPIIKEYVKENRLSYKRVEDVFKILNYYNTL